MLDAASESLGKDEHASLGASLVLQITKLLSLK